MSMIQEIKSQVNRGLTEIETVELSTLTSEQRTSYLKKLSDLENSVQVQWDKLSKKLEELGNLQKKIEKRKIDFKPIEFDSEKITVKTLFNDVFEIGPFPAASTTQMDVKKAINQARGIPVDSIHIIVEGGKYFTDDATLIMKTFIKRPCLIHVVKKMERAGANKAEVRVNKAEVRADKTDAAVKESGLFSWFNRKFMNAE